ncbi:MAG: tetratricopeptide repeat protein [Spirochaetia bacterium]|nr:tetratricopeptide repeat protein [Spirochaetia bacterium]
MKNFYIIAGSLIILSGLGVITFNREVFSPDREARSLLTKAKLLIDQDSMETQKESMEILTTIASRFPDSKQAKEALFELAELYEKWGNIDVATSKYRSLLGLNLDKNLADKVKFKIARLQLSRYNSQEGLNALMVLLSENVDDMVRSDIYTEIARFYYRQKNLSAAKSNYEIAISENSKNKEADMELGDVLFEEKKYNDALRQYEHFFNIYINRSERSENTAANFQKKLLESAQELFHDNNMGEAENYFAFISDKFPSSMSSEVSLYYLGNLEYLQGNYEKALEKFDMVIKFPPDFKDENAYIKKGQCYYQMRNYSKSALYFAKFSELYPGSKHKSLARKWEKESKMALRDKVEIENLNENNQSDKPGIKSSKKDIEDFFENDMPVEPEMVTP